MTPTTPDSSAASSPQRLWRCGTLTYTKAGLMMLFFWLLWGDFCYTLTEAVVPSILPLKLKALGCPNWLMSTVMTTVPGVFGMTLCPWISYRSDRCRSRWGRRMPFILLTMPMLCGCMILLGSSDHISAMLQQNLAALHHLAPATVTLTLIAIFFIAFTFFNDFVASVVYCLFNDVVPPEVVARFLGVYRIIGNGASALYNYFIFRYAESHMREIFIGAALLYFFGFGLVCLMIKEGKYPPIEEKPTARKASPLNGLRNFLRESFSQKFYWLLFLIFSINMALLAVNFFQVFFYQNMGLSLDYIGKITAVGGLAAMAAMYFAAIYVDRWHPFRVFVHCMPFSVIGMLMGWVWLFVDLPAVYFFWLTLGMVVISSFMAALNKSCQLPSYMRLFPKSRFAQFCSAQAMLGSFVRIGAGFIAGAFFDITKRLSGNSDYGYRFNFLWSTFFMALMAAVAFWAYREWHRLGGDAHYHPPAPWSETKIEKMPIVTITSPQSRWLDMALRLYDLITTISLLGLFPLMWWMYSHGQMTALYWYAVAILPLSIGCWWYWFGVKRQIRRDMERCRSGQELINGIPHHGVLIVAAIKFLLLLVLWFCQVAATINLKLEIAAVIFGLGNVLTNVLLVSSVWGLARLERGTSSCLDGHLALASPNEAEPDEEDAGPASQVCT